MFPLGGLAGLPFTGKTGWGAFSAHCPADGNIVLLFAPHVGVSKDGKVGQVYRCGQESSSSACGAAIGAYNALKANRNAAIPTGGFADAQMDSIKQLLSLRMDRIDPSNEMTELTYQMFHIVDEFVKDIVNSNWMTEKSQLCLVGGIMINCDDNAPDMFLPLKFEVQKKDGTS